MKNLDDHGSDAPFYRQDERPWGSFEQFTDNEVSTVKLLHVFPNERLSLQKHAQRSEFWRVVEGTGTITVDDSVREVVVGDEAFIPIGSLHRLAGGLDGITVLEIARGEFDENDIQRVEDDFGRGNPEVDAAIAT